eukprot:g16532.t1
MVNLTSMIQSSGDGRKDGNTLGYGGSAARRPNDTVFNPASGERTRAYAPSSNQAETSSVNNCRKRDKRTRRVATESPMTSTSVEPGGSESSTPAEPGSATKVKMETGLFEGRPSGSFQSRRRGREERIAPASEHGGPNLARNT